MCACVYMCVLSCTCVCKCIHTHKAGASASPSLNGTRPTPRSCRVRRRASGRPPQLWVQATARRGQRRPRVGQHAVDALYFPVSFFIERVSPRRGLRILGIVFVRLIYFSKTPRGDFVPKHQGVLPWGPPSPPQPVESVSPPAGPGQEAAEPQAAGAGAGTPQAPRSPPSASLCPWDESLFWGSVCSPPESPGPLRGPSACSRPSGDTCRPPASAPSRALWLNSFRPPRALTVGEPRSAQATAAPPAGADPGPGQGAASRPFAAPPSRQDGKRETTVHASPHLRLFPARRLLLRAGEEARERRACFPWFPSSSVPTALPPWTRPRAAGSGGRGRAASSAPASCAGCTPVGRTEPRGAWAAAAGRGAPVISRDTQTLGPGQPGRPSSRPGDGQLRDAALTGPGSLGPGHGSPPRAGTAPVAGRLFLSRRGLGIPTSGKFPHAGRGRSAAWLTRLP